MAYNFLIQRRQDLESHRQFSLLMLQQAEKTHIEKQLSEWEQSA